MAQMTRGGTGKVADYHRTKGDMETRLLERDEKVRSGPTNAFGFAVPRDLSAVVDRPSGDVKKTDAVSFTSTVDAPSAAGPRGDMMPVGVGALDAAPAPARAPRQPMASGGALKKGTYNSDDVRALQTSLKDIAALLDDKSLDPGNVDSDFGGNTERAVKAFQKRYGLIETGVVDAGTLREIQTIQSNLSRDGAPKPADGEKPPYGLPTPSAEDRRLGAMADAELSRRAQPAPIKVGSPQFTALLGAQLSFDQIDGLLASGLIDEDIATALKTKSTSDSRREQGVLRGALGYPES